MKSNQRLALIICGWGAVVLLLGWGALTWENRSGAQAWDATRRYLEAEGESLDLASLRPAPVPDEENFFATPLLSALTNEEEADRGPGRFLRLPDVTSSPDLSLPDWRTARVADLSGLAAEMRGDPAFPKVDEGLSPAVQVLAKLDGRFHAEFLELERAVSRPSSRVPWHYDLPVELRLGAGHPEVSHLRDIERIHLVRAGALVSERKPDEALDSWIVAFRVAEASQQPRLLGLMIRITYLAQISGPIWQGCATQQWRPEHLGVIEANLAKIDLKNEALGAFRAEMLGSIEMMDWLKIEGPEAADAIKFLGPSKWALWLPPGWWDFNKASTARMVYDGSIKPLKVGGKVSRIASSRSGFRPHAVFADMSETAYPLVSKRLAQVITELHLARTGCAVERYHARHGRYPTALADLVPDFLPAVLTDFAGGGGPLSYKLSPDGRFYRIYAFGLDGDDDGGVVALRSGGRWDREAGDTVWTNEIQSAPAASSARK